METKLTLRMDEKIIKEAKNYAQKRGVSLSKLVAEYFKMISKKQDKTFIPTPILSEISGVLQNSAKKKDLGKEYKKYLEEKYL